MGFVVVWGAVIGCPVSGVSTLSSDRGQNSEDLAGRHQPSSKEHAIYVWLFAPCGRSNAGDVAFSIHAP